MKAQADFVRKAELSNYRGLKGTAQKYTHFFIKNWVRGLVGSFLYLWAILGPRISCVS